jgi:LruC domain-containing protein
MKKIILSIAILLGFSITTLQAQVTLDCESGDRGVDAGNCWAFGAVSYTSTSSMVISGKWSARSNSMSNPSPTACWIKSPFIKLGKGDITFNVKLENTSGTTKTARIRFISYDANNKSTGEGTVYTDSFSYNWPSLNTKLVNISYAVPTALANSGAVYKVIISFLGTGGNNRCNIDDIVIPGTYWADPTNNCLPLSTVVDADGDGVADGDDAYPNDKYRAFNNFLNGDQFGTLLCEDLWPNKGDYDFNDLVFDYRLNAVTNADNNIVELKFEIVTRAIGASYHNGFACEIVNVSPSKIISVKGNKLSGKVFKVSSNGTEEGQTNANIPFFDDAYDVLKYPGGTGGINTKPESPRAAYDSMTIVATFIEDGKPASGGTLSFEEFSKLNDPLNPYLVINQERGKEVHLIDMPPTDLASQKLFGQGDDASDAGKGLYYRSAKNLPWMIAVAKSIPYATEKTEFSKAFVNFVNWAASEGREYADWYVDEKGFRNPEYLFTK